jgi:hypothetical protein
MAQGTGAAVVFADAWGLAAVHGQSYEPDSMALHTHDGVDQIWFQDISTIQDRVSYVRDVAGLGGIGFWALHYDGDDPALWSMIHDETTWRGTTPGTTDTGSSPTTDTGPATTPGTDTDPTDPGNTEGPRADDPTNQVVPPPPPETAGCGCASAPATERLHDLLSRRR